MSGAARFYRTLLRLYPRSYRQRFGAEMLQTFLDWHEDLGGTTGRVSAWRWCAMVIDEVRNIGSQRLATLGSQRPHMFALKLAVPAFLLSVTAKAPHISAHSAHDGESWRVSLHLPAALTRLGALLSLAAPTRAYAQDVTRPLPIDALIDLNTLSYRGIGSLSPDGRWLVYTVREGARLRGKSVAQGERYLPTGLSADYTTGTNLYLVDTRTGARERITDDVGRYEEPVWSPDGRAVAFYSDRDGEARVWVWELATRKLRRLARDRVHPSEFASLRWTPDSKSVIALLEGGASGARRPVAARDDAKPSAPDDSTIAPGATVHVYRAGPSTDSVARTSAGIDTVTMDTVSIWGHMDADLATIRLADGAVRRLALGRPIFWYAPSPNGRWIAFSHQSALIRAGGQAMYDYEVVPLAGGDVRTVVRRARAGYGTASWSPDGKTLAYASVGAMADGDIWLADVEAGRSRKLTSAPHPRLLAEDATPYWSPDGRALFLSLNGQIWKAALDDSTLESLPTTSLGRYLGTIVTDPTRSRIHSPDGGRSLTVTAIDLTTKNVGFYRVDATTGAATKLREEPRRYGGSRWPPLASRDGSTIVYYAEDGQHPPDVWGGPADLASPKQLTTLNPQISNASLGRTRVIDFLGPNGQPLQAVLLYPGNYEEGKRYPLIVRVYPGPYQFANNVHAFGLDGADGIQNMQMFASRGYAVVMPEIPQDLGTPMRDLVEGVNAAVNKVIEMGVADPERLGVTGQSYGGYSTIAIATQTTRFKAALMSAGLGNLLDAALLFRPASGTDESFWTEGGQGLMGGTLWEQRERYLANSPILYLDRVKTPVLIVHGEQDDAFPVSLSDQIFVGLRRLGRQVEYRRYAGEGHVIGGGENVADYWRAAIRWFDTYVKNAGAETPSGARRSH